MNKEISIIYEDELLLVVKKPAGLAVQTKKLTEPDMLGGLKKHAKEIYIVHRLDQPVEGLMVFAKTKAAAAALSKQVQNGGGMNKEYIAKVYGHMPEKAGSYTDWLLKDGRTNTSRVVSENTKEAKRAELHYEEVSRDEHTSTLRIKLLTGRHHQIRVQLASRGTPILGDHKYGNTTALDYAQHNNIRQLALRAVKLEFTHPESGQPMRFSDESLT